MSRGRLLVGAGVVALLAAAAIAFVPDLLPVPQDRLVSVMDSVTGLASLGALALLSGLISVAQGLLSSKTPQTPPALTPIHDTDDADGGPSGPVAGEDFDERLGATERVGDRTAQGEAVIREDLRKLAIDIYQQAEDCDWETAARAVDEGRWTDEPAAADFLGGPDAPSLPLWTWFRYVLSDSGAFYNQTTATIRELYRLQAEAAPDNPALPTEIADLQSTLEPESQSGTADDSWDADDPAAEAATDGGETHASDRGGDR